VALGLLPPGADRAAIVPALTGGPPARPLPHAHSWKPSLPPVAL